MCCTCVIAPTVAAASTYPRHDEGSIVSVLFPLGQSDGVPRAEATPVEVGLADGRVSVHDARDVQAVLMDATDDCVLTLELGFVCNVAAG